MDSDNFLYKLKTILSYNDLCDLIRGVDGFLLDIQAYALMTLANEGPGAGVIVEIGSYMGRSTCCLALGSKCAAREKVFAVDHFTGSPEHQKGAPSQSLELLERGTTFPKFEENVRKAGVSDYVEPIRAASVEASTGWNKPIRLLFIDGDHAYEASKLDFECWAPHVVPGGIIAFHDIGYAEGVTKFYQELVQNSPDYQHVLDISGLAIVEKKSAGPV